MTPPRAQLPPLPATVRTLTDEALGWLEVQHPDLRKGPADCVTCRGRRTFRWWDAERTSTVEYDCPCNEQYILHLRLLYAGVGLAYQRLDWADFLELPKAAEDAAVEYVQNAETFAESGIGMLLWGDRGTGKTMLAELMLKDLVCRHRVDGLSITFAALLEAFSGGWRDAKLKTWFDGRLRNAGLLLVNDVGREHRGERTIADSTLEDVLRSRAEHGRPTIITSNLRPAELTTYYGPNTASLMTESMIEVEFRGSDRRMAVKARMLDEIKQGLTRPVTIGE
jgi:DNA replication protein DnaC